MSYFFQNHCFLSWKQKEANTSPCDKFPCNKAETVKPPTPPPSDLKKQLLLVDVEDEDTNETQLVIEPTNPEPVSVSTNQESVQDLVNLEEPVTNTSITGNAMSSSIDFTSLNLKKGLTHSNPSFEKTNKR